MRDMKWMHGAQARALKALQAEADELRAEIRREVAAEVFRCGRRPGRRAGWPPSGRRRPHPGA
jgi:hypothetical protein